MLHARMALKRGTATALAQAPALDLQTEQQLQQQQQQQQVDQKDTSIAELEDRLKQREAELQQMQLTLDEKDATIARMRNAINSLTAPQNLGAFTSSIAATSRNSGVQNRSGSALSIRAPSDIPNPSLENRRLNSLGTPAPSQEVKREEEDNGVFAEGSWGR